MEFTDESLHEIAKKTLQRKTGARGLRAIMEDILLEPMFEVPNQSLIKKIIVDKNAVVNSTHPLFVYENTKKKKSS